MSTEYTLSDQLRDIVTSHSITVVAIVIAGLFLVLQLLRIGSRPSDFPPGPPTIPIVGNLHQLPSRNVHLQYQKWAKQYGPIFSLKLGQQTTVVLADGHVIRDLVDARGGNYADRPHLWARDLFDDSRIIMRGYDDLWRLERKMYHSFLNINVAKKYLPYQEVETLKLCVDLLHTPEDFVQSLGRMTGSIASSMTYGFRLPDKDSPIAHEMLENSRGFFNCIARTQYMDWYPSLRPLLGLLPRSLNPLARDAVRAYKKERAVFQKYYATGLTSSAPCFVRDVASAQHTMKGTADGDLLTDHAATYITGISFEGGADTTRYTLQGFIKAMAMFPDVQIKAQQEIDMVVSASELPSGKHLKQFRYVNATVKETVRWMPTAINGAIPHAALKEDYYRGFRIPQGATIVLAVWSANHDDNEFTDPRTFDPDRQISDTTLYQSATATSPRERGQWGFGSGRRMCPGMHVAHNTLLLAISRMLWAFDIHMAEDEAGKEIPIERDAMVGGLAAAPAPFRCSIIPRSPERASLVEREWEKISAELMNADGNYKENVLS